MNFSQEQKEAINKYAKIYGYFVSKSDAASSQPAISLDRGGNNSITNILTPDFKGLRFNNDEVPKSTTWAITDEGIEIKIVQDAKAFVLKRKSTDFIQ